MRDEQQRARPAIKQVFDRCEHIDVQIVSRFVEDEHVGFFQQDEHERQASLLPARQIAHRLVQIGIRETKPFEQLFGGLVAPVEHDGMSEASHDLAHAVVAVRSQLVEVLREHCELHGLADLHVSARRPQLLLDHVQQRGLACAVAAHDADAVAGADEPLDAVQHGVVAVAHRHVLHVDDLLAQTLHGHALELELVAQRRDVGDELLRCFDAELLLGRTRLRTTREPCELAAQLVLPTLLGHACHAVALDALHDVGREPAFERLDALVVHFPHARAGLVEEPAVVRYDEQGTLTFTPARLQMLCQPIDGTYIQMVRGLVEHEGVPVTHEQSRQIDTATLTARKRSDRRLPVDVSHDTCDDATNARATCPFIFGQVTHDGPTDRIVVGQFVDLRKHADGNVVGPDNASAVGFEQTTEQRQQRRLAVAIAADDADALAVVHAKRDFIEHRFRGEVDPDFLASKQKCHAQLLFGRRLLGKRHAQRVE